MSRFESLNICSGVDEARILPLLNSNQHIALFTIHQVKGVFRSLLTFTSILLNIFICWSKPVWLCSAGIMPFFDLTNVHNYIVYNLASKELELVFEPIVSSSTTPYFHKKANILNPYSRKYNIYLWLSINKWINKTVSPQSEERLGSYIPLSLNK